MRYVMEYPTGNQAWQSNILYQKTFIVAGKICATEETFPATMFDYLTTGQLHHPLLFVTDHPTSMVDANIFRYPRENSTSPTLRWHVTCQIIPYFCHWSPDLDCTCMIACCFTFAHNCWCMLTCPLVGYPLSTYLNRECYELAKFLE